MVRKNKDIPFPQQPQQQKVNIDLSQADDVKCDSCGNYTFTPILMMKRLSPIISPTGKEAIIPIDTFACNACGFINKEFLPTMPKTEVESE